MSLNNKKMCNKCISYLKNMLNQEMQEYSISLEEACKKIMFNEIEEPLVKSGDDAYQVTEAYKSPWDADNVNFVLALYCVLFPKIKPEGMECLRWNDRCFYECKRKGRIGETLNSFNTMFGTENAKDRLKDNALDVNEELSKKVKSFRNSYHSAANFIPFLGSLNYSKDYDTTGWNYLGDFWDIKLKIIKDEWDKIIDNSTSVPLLHMNRAYF